MAPAWRPATSSRIRSTRTIWPRLSPGFLVCARPRPGSANPFSKLSKPRRINRCLKLLLFQRVEQHRKRRRVARTPGRFARLLCRRTQDAHDFFESGRIKKYAPTRASSWSAPDPAALFLEMCVLNLVELGLKLKTLGISLALASPSKCFRDLRSAFGEGR